MEIVRLGQGVDATGRLAPDALARTFAMLAEYARAISDSGASAVRLVATSATRDASNAAAFVPASGGYSASIPRLSAARRRPSCRSPARRPSWAAGPGRASLSRRSWSWTSAVALPSSCSVRRGRRRHGLAAISVNIGCVRLTERHLHDDPPAREQVAAATEDIDDALATVAASIPVASARTLVGLAGSVTTLTAVALGLAGYDPARIHHARISARRVHEVTASLLGQDHSQRAAGTA